VPIPTEVIEQIRERVRLSDIVKDFVELKRSGSSLSACCPFHQEKTPSFFIKDDEGYFNCFGCGKKGSVFDFVMAIRGFTFPEAARYLAAKAGITIVEEEGEQDSERQLKKQQRADLMKVLDAASKAYQNQLNTNKSSKLAHDYFSRRDINKDTIAKFKLGFAPAGWEFIASAVEQILKSSGVSLSELEVINYLQEVGLLRPKRAEFAATDEQESGNVEKNVTFSAGFYDTLRERIIFPIMRSDGLPIAFGARLIREIENAPKYLNTQESQLYQKRKTLYGLTQAMKELRATRHAYIVEGYMDVISFSQAGLEESLATCGTALTVDHVNVISRLADKVSLVFDADSAGRKAASSCFEVFLNSGIEVNVVNLPDGEDPDSLAKKIPAKDLRKFLSDHAKPVVQAYLDYALKSKEDQSEQNSSAVLLGKVSERFAKILAQVKNPVEQETLLRLGAERLGVSFSALESMVSNFSSGGASKFKPNDKSKTPDIVKTTRKSNSQQRGVIRNENQSKATKSVRKNSSEIASFQLQEQLVIAVICEPMLAQSIVGIASIWESAGISQQMKQFVEEVIDLGQTESFIEDSNNSSQLVALLAKHGLPGEKLIAEAKRQLKVGGIKPAALINELNSFQVRYSLTQEVTEIRIKEQTAGNQIEAEKLVQQKLEKKRALKDLHRVNHN
jgi:DNA primase